MNLVICTCILKSIIVSHEFYRESWIWKIVSWDLWDVSGVCGVLGFPGRSWEVGREVFLWFVDPVGG